jgi:hypothetical protein
MMRKWKRVRRGEEEGIMSFFFLKLFLFLCG